MYNKEQQEAILRMLQAREIERQRMIYESIYSPSQNQSSAGDGGFGAGAAFGGGGDPNASTFTPFILQSWAMGPGPAGSLYRLKANGEKVIIDNAPEFFGPTVFSKNTRDGLTYFVTFNTDTNHANIGCWNQLTGEWSYLEEGVTRLRDLPPASLQYVEGNDNGMGENYFIYTDNSLYNLGEGDIAPKTWIIELDGPGAVLLTELHEWEVPDTVGYFPISYFYELPVAVGASPSQFLYQVEQYGWGGGIPTAYLTIVNPDTYEKIPIDVLTLDGHGFFIDGIKIAYILDRTDYEGEIYFNLWVQDKFTEQATWFIAKFDPNSETPSNLKAVYQYEWDDSAYVGLTTI